MMGVCIGGSRGWGWGVGASFKIIIESCVGTDTTARVLS